MANICTNVLQTLTKDKENIKAIKEFFADDDSALIEHNKDYLEVRFESKWIFPDKYMDELYQKIPHKENLRIECLSVEWGNFYCEFHECNKNGWKALNGS